jgi:hypothetical protein
MGDAGQRSQKGDVHSTVTGEIQRAQTPECIDVERVSLKSSAKAIRPTSALCGRFWIPMLLVACALSWRRFDEESNEANSPGVAIGKC